LLEAEKQHGISTKHRAMVATMINKRGIALH